jgi:CHAT domain-containing protein
MDTGLRAIPLGVLHDGKQFLIEKYSLGLIPSLNLTDTRYQSLKDAHVLAMGASEFVEEKPLPAVPVELSTITPSYGQENRFSTKRSL